MEFLKELGKLIRGILIFCLVCCAACWGIVGVGLFDQISLTALFVVLALFFAGIVLFMRKSSPIALRVLGVTWIMPCVIEGFFWSTFHYNMYAPNVHVLLR